MTFTQALHTNLSHELVMYQEQRKQLKSGPASNMKAVQRKKILIELSVSISQQEDAQSIHVPSHAPMKRA